MLSRRVPPPGSSNAWSALLNERRAGGLELLDLTEANPTRVGLNPIDTDGLTVLGDPGAAAYEPDPRGLRSAREAVARYCADRGAEVDPDHIILTSGTSEAYAHLIRLLCDPGDRILAPRPSYPLFEPLATAEGVELGFYDWHEREGWRLDLDALEQAMTPRTRALIVVSPNHPTGSCLDAADLDALVRACDQHGVAIIADEVFGDYPRPGVGPLPSLLAERRVPTFVLSGLSKVCGLPQMKLSWIVVAGPEAARAQALHGLEWLADLFLSVSTPAQLAAPRWLENRHAFQARLRERIALNLGEWRARTGAGIEVLAADGGWVGIVRLGSRPPAQGWEIDLMHHGVAIHPAYFYDLEDASCLVASLIVEPPVVRAAAERIEALVSA